LYPTRRRPLHALLVLAALAAAIVPLPRWLVERAYSAGVYPRLQPVLTGASNLAPIALLDVAIAAVLLAWLVGVANDLRSSRGVTGALFAVVVRTAAWAAAAYLLFLATWGFNYRRVPLIDKLPFDGARVTPERARSAAEATVVRLNTLYASAHAAGWAAAVEIDRPLASAFDAAVRDAGIDGRVTVGRPKRTVLDWYFRRAGVDGMTDPYFLETLVAGNLLPFERPVVIAHEWAHLAGIADEGDANFVGWLACMRGAPAHQYSGWLFLYTELVNAVSAADRTALRGGLAPGPRADLIAIRDRVTRDVNPAVSTAGWRVYDSYLKANRVEAGAASYADVVRLVLGARVADSAFE
jgi:hypothetical protein